MNVFDRIRAAVTAPKGVNKKGSPPPPLYPYQLERVRHDIKMWREAIRQAEFEYYPLRVKMQRMYLDTMLNLHVKACLKRRKNLTLSRKFKMCDENGKENEEVTKIFKAQWFRTFQSYSLDALFFGYNVIRLNDVTESKFKDIRFVPRHFVSPDRKEINRFPEAPHGTSLEDPQYKDWYIYISTPDEVGSSPCGYGELYEIAIIEIMLRNNIGQNADYNEMFGVPLKVGKTYKKDAEKSVFEQALASMGSAAYIILDDGLDNLEIVDAPSRGSAFQTFDNFEKRCEHKISKLLLGHADALDSVPGKLGASVGEGNPVIDALNAKQSEDAEFIEPIVNEELIPRMKRMGFIIPDGLHFEFVNDEEKEQFRRREDESNTKTAQLLNSIKMAGGDLGEETWAWFEERTGIPGVTKFVAPEPTIGGGGGGFPAPAAADKKPAAAADKKPEDAPDEKKKVPGSNGNGNGKKPGLKEEAIFKLDVKKD